MKILFIIHDTAQNGATVTMLRYISWLRKNTEFSVHFLLPFRSSFDDIFFTYGKVFYWSLEKEHNSLHFSKFLKSTIKKHINNKILKKILIAKLRQQKYDLIYGNTIVSEKVLRELKVLSVPEIVHIHENELSVELYNSKGLSICNSVDKIIATSDYTARYISGQTAIPVSKISIHIPPVSEREFTVDEINIPGDCFVIGSSGSGISQKGMAVFIMMARILVTKENKTGFHFLWIGSELIDPVLRFDLEQSGLLSRFSFTGYVSNPDDYYKKVNLFVSCSREESFGLSIAECASLDVPFLCFPTVGLLDYFESTIRNEFTVSYLDLYEMTDRIIALSRNETLRENLGKVAGKVCRGFQIHHLGPLWYNTITSVAKRESIISRE